MQVRAGDIDWVARYAQMVHAAEVRAAPRPADRWEGRAERFDKKSREELGALEGLATLVRPDDVVLDIGAGTGRHAFPLARRCARVVALEPSPSMREKLIARLAEERVANLEVRANNWPDVTVPIADVVFAAHVVYGVAEIAPFVATMTTHARRACALLLKLRAPADALAHVYEAVWGVSRPRRPAALEALAVLHQLGLAAELTLVEGSGRSMIFADTEEDLRELAHRVGVTPDRDGLHRVREALARVAERTGEGWLAGETGPTVCLCWEGVAS